MVGRRVREGVGEEDQETELSLAYPGQGDAADLAGHCLGDDEDGKQWGHTV